MVKGEEKRFQLWPGLAVPFGFTLLLGLAGWLFVNRVEAERERVIDASRRMESRARLESAEIADAAAVAAGDFVSTRLTARQAQERNLAAEAKGVMESVGRLITLGMERNRRHLAAVRDVGSFPSGFEGLERVFGMMPREEAGDRARAALEAHSPEIASLLPAGYALTVVEDHAREMLSLGAFGGGADMMTAVVTRDLIFDDNHNQRRWTLRLEVNSPDQYPTPTAADVASHLEQRLGGVRPDLTAWRGWLVNANGAVAAAFPAESGRDFRAVPYINAPGQWRLLDDGGSLVWLEPLRQSGGIEWRVGVSVMIPAPEMELTFADALEADMSWAATLAGFALACLASWIWLIRSCLAGPAKSRESAQPRVKTSAASAASVTPAASAALAAVSAAAAAPGLPKLSGLYRAQSQAGRAVRRLAGRRGG